MANPVLAVVVLGALALAQPIAVASAQYFEDEAQYLAADAEYHGASPQEAEADEPEAEADAQPWDAGADLDQVNARVEGTDFEAPAEIVPSSEVPPSVVAVQRQAPGSFRYLVNGAPQLFVGMGYNPVYRRLSDEERAACYDRDFQILAQAGVNHIIGWDADKGYEQDKFDELTLDHALKQGLGVVMPFYLPPDADYGDEAFQQSLMDEAAAKIARFKGHPALRMWGVGNEVLSDMLSWEMRFPFVEFYARLAEHFHQLDPNHPVVYREAEDVFIPLIGDLLRNANREDLWLLYGMNIYTMQLGLILDDWQASEDLPLVVTEFGFEADETGERAPGYLAMWRTIRAHPDFVVGGAPYVWTTEGPEPTDRKWGLTDGSGHPVDGTFEQLAAEWRREAGGQAVMPDLLALGHDGWLLP